MKKTSIFLIVFLISSMSFAQVTWNMGMNVAASSFGNMHPRITTNAAGDPLIIWYGNMNAMFSRWNGSSFTTPVALNIAPMMIAGASWMGPDIASQGDTVYAVFKASPEADTSSHIYLVRSFDGGATFSLPFQVDNIGDSISRFPTVSIDKDGQPVVAFMKFDNTFMDSRWVVTRSNDFGNTFNTDTKASGYNGSTAVCDCCPGAVISAEVNGVDNVYMLYRDNNNNIRDMWAGVSTDNGISFPNGISVDQNNWQVFSCSASGPDGVVVGDSLYTVYMSGANGFTRVYHSVSALNPVNPSFGSEITGGFTGLGVQNYPRIATDGDLLAIVWRQTVSGTDQAALMIREIGSEFPITYDTVDLGNVVDVDLALHNGNIFVVWEDNGSGTIKYRSGAYGDFTGTDNLFQNTITVTPSVTNNFIEIEGAQLNSQLSISDATGRIVVRKIISQKTLQLNLEQLQNGIYFLTIENQLQKLFTTKITKY